MNFENKNRKNEKSNLEFLNFLSCSIRAIIKRKPYPCHKNNIPETEQNQL